MAVNEKHSLAKALAWLTQLGINMISPLIICIIAALWLKNKFNLSNSIVVVAIIIGAASGYMSLIKFIREVKKYSVKENDSDAQQNKSS